jgi:hypothetical protein
MSWVEDRLSFFVDRDEEIAQFRAMIDRGPKRILSVTGGEGLGKSLLMERMVYECALSKRRTIKIICRNTRNDALFIMRSIRDDLAVECFEEFTKLWNALAAPIAPTVSVHVNAPITVGAGLTAGRHAQLGDITGVKITQDLMMDRMDPARRGAERLALLTDPFLRGLGAALQDGSIVVFLDDCQKMTAEAEQWLRDELLFAVKEGLLSNAYFVLLSQKTPDLDAWRYLTDQAELRPLTRDCIAIYLEKRSIEEPVRTDLVSMLWVVTKGRIAEIERYVEAYLQERQRTR